MHSIERDTVVEAPIEQVYDQWTQFEEFPRFMEGVTEVRQLDDRHLHWRAQVLGSEREWDAEIDQQLADARIRWHSTSGKPINGAVFFERWDMDRTKLTLQMEYELDGAAETVADALGFIGRQVEGDLERFKDFIESRPAATGAWRGEIADEWQPDVRAEAEERQREPGPGSAPGGNPAVDTPRGAVRDGIDRTP
ncbi:MAG: SRPBCC family protein [Dehalococcoidia bacterium]